MSDIPRPEQRPKTAPPVIVEMFKLLPEPGAIWPAEKRKEFIAALDHVFNVVYAASSRKI